MLENNYWNSCHNNTRYTFSFKVQAIFQRWLVVTLSMMMLPNHFRGIRDAKTQQPGHILRSGAKAKIERKMQINFSGGLNIDLKRKINRYNQL